MSVHETLPADPFAASLWELAHDEVDRTSEMFMKVAKHGGNIALRPEESLLLIIHRGQGDNLQVAHYEYDEPAFIEIDGQSMLASARTEKKFIIQPDKHVISTVAMDMQRENEINHDIFSLLEAARKSHDSHLHDDELRTLVAERAKLKAERFGHIPPLDELPEAKEQAAIAGELRALLRSAWQVQLSSDRQLED